MSANAYLGADALRAAVDSTAKVIVTARRSLAVRRPDPEDFAALHFVCTRRGRDRGAVTLNLDAHGKSLSSALLELDLPDSEPSTSAREGRSG